MRPLVSVTLVAVYATLFAGGEVAAYVRSTTNDGTRPLRWADTNCIRVRAHLDGSDDLNDGSELEALDRAAGNWLAATASCAYIRFIVEEPTTAVRFGTKPGRDNETAVVWIEEGWERDAQHDPGAAALTTVWFVADPGGERHGVITDADIELNGDLFTFGSAGESNRTDVENTLTHELGHVLGLDHPCYVRSPPAPHPVDHRGLPIPSCDNATAEMRATTMFTTTFPGELDKRTPADDDVAGICAIYPIEADPGRCGTEGGCCAVAADADVAAPLAWGLLLALALLCGRRGRTA